MLLLHPIYLSLYNAVLLDIQFLFGFLEYKYPSSVVLANHNDIDIVLENYSFLQVQKDDTHLTTLSLLFFHAGEHPSEVESRDFCCFSMPAH